MNQWDKKPTMTVVYGEHVTRHVLQQVGYAHLGIDSDKAELPTTDAVVYNTESMNGQEHIDMVINGLQDHINNVDDTEWLSPQGDYAVVVDDDELWVNISIGTYFGQNCKATVYVVTI